VRRALLLLALALSGAAGAEELIGKVGTRGALLVLQASPRADGSSDLVGEYVILPTLARRFLQGERSPQLGVTVLKEGTTPILFGRPGTGELRGTWREGVFRGTRYGEGGQRREEFEFSEQFPAMDRYSARVRCEAREARYESRLDFSVREGRLERFEWRSTEPGGHSCAIIATAQEPIAGGLRFRAGGCRVTLRDAGEFVAVRAEGCSALCAGEAHVEPLLVDRRGNCELLRFGAR
jgi:hypothetical protein